jgi:drug/metabolite transporter (DMT)-like permease
MGGFSVQNTKDMLLLALAILKNPYILIGTTLMASSFFLWLFILSWFKLSLVFPLTALTYIFVALLSYYLLGEKLFLQNYVGIFFMAIGVFFLLLK